MEILKIKSEFRESTGQVRTLSIFGHQLQSIFYAGINCCKLGDPHHVEDFLKVVGDAGNTDLLIVLFRQGQYLDQHSDAATVDVSIFINF